MVSQEDIQTMQEELKRRLVVIAGYDKNNPFGELVFFDWVIIVLFLIALPLSIVVLGA